MVKIIFRFRERFWEERGDFSFVLSKDRYMPTWWTSAPARSPLLTGWAGGHPADRLLAEGREAMIERALDSLASTFGVDRRRVFPNIGSRGRLEASAPARSAFACASSYQVQQLQARSVRVMEHERGGSNDAGIRAERRTFHRRQWFGRHSGFRDFQNQGIEETIAQ